MSLDLFAAIKTPYLTADLPGIGGRIKSTPEDFEVEEIPAYEPCGAGDFLFLWIEKRGMGAEYFIRQIARRLDIPIGAVRAGLKDRHAVTRQWVSVPIIAEPRLAQLEGDGIRVLRVGRHGNKLRAGHLHGNRFRVVIRDVSKEVDSSAVVNAVVDRIRSHGLPNFYGSQRFGRDGETLQMGLALVSDPRSGTRKTFLRKLALSAVQSALFNRYLAERMSDGLMQRVLHGDVMAKWPFGGMFVAEDAAVEQQRFDRRETVSAGPIFGKKTFPAKHEAQDREARILAGAGMSRESFAQFGKLLMGTRRHNLIYVEDLSTEQQPDGVQLSFTLPAGSYATVLLSEVMKVALAEEEAVATSEE